MNYSQWTVAQQFDTQEIVVPNGRAVSLQIEDLAAAPDSVDVSLFSPDLSFEELYLKEIQIQVSSDAQFTSDVFNKVLAGNNEIPPEAYTVTTTITGLNPGTRYNVRVREGY